MASISEAAYAALAAVLAPAFVPFGVDDFRRNVSALSDMKALPAGGEIFATLRDAGVEIDVELLSPRSYELMIRAQIELVVADADDARRDATFDEVLIAIDDALDADRALDGAVTDAEIERLDPVDLAIEGAEGSKAALVTIRMLARSPRPF
ncbi:hypothetical protein [Hansschlegelia zhihuaiae]|uniref:DUF3168 domain-containing protein n=1 Tax=Hansschlegelia zhihuaiae TaxID=405005 RepID=A0A4Q0MF68_9HYPH|nr:hypothetical protein [Hansschlegelia zhihuaiae]RXF72120.1 hypothetical protein EK403_15025 [Hansschlegelia zhihuaiae]